MCDKPHVVGIEHSHVYQMEEQLDLPSDRPSHTLNACDLAVTLIHQPHIHGVVVNYIWLPNFLLRPPVAFASVRHSSCVDGREKVDVTLVAPFQGQ